MSNSIFDWLQLLAENIWLYGGAFILVLSILVFVHEWGHYIIARKCGVKVEVFSIGFGKELFGFNDKNGTRWKFSLVPLGGYVKMFGDTDPASAQHLNGIEEEDGNVRKMTKAEEKVAFYTQSVGKRSAIVFAGPAINFIFAIILLAGLYGFYGQPVTPAEGAAVMCDSAAAKAGFEPHDMVIAIDGKKILRFEDIRREVMVGLDTEREFTVLRDNREITITATPDLVTEEDHFGFKHSKGLLGLISPGNAIDIARIKSIRGEDMGGDVDKVRQTLLLLMNTTFTIELDRGPELDTLYIHPRRDMNNALNDPESLEHNYLVISRTNEETFVKHGVVGGFAVALQETWTISTSTLQALLQMIVGTRSATELGGIIRIGAIAGDMAKSGILALITFTALLSINLGLINLFPIPMLDGGHLVFYIIEAVKGSPIPDQIQEYAFRFGLVILVGIMLFANLNDIVQLVL